MTVPRVSADGAAAWMLHLPELLGELLVFDLAAGSVAVVVEPVAFVIRQVAAHEAGLASGNSLAARHQFPGR